MMGKTQVSLWVGNFDSFEAIHIYVDEISRNRR